MRKKVQEKLVRLMLSGLTQVMMHANGNTDHGIEEPPVGLELHDFPYLPMFIKFAEELADPSVSRTYFISFMSPNTTYPVDGYEVFVNKEGLTVKVNGTLTEVTKYGKVQSIMEPTALEQLFWNILRASPDLTNLVDTFKGGKDESRKARQ